MIPISQCVIIFLGQEYVLYSLQYLVLQELTVIPNMLYLEYNLEVTSLHNND